MPFYQILLILFITAAIDWLVLRAWHERKKWARLLKANPAEDHALDSNAGENISRSRWLILLSFVLLTAGLCILNLRLPLIESDAYYHFLVSLNQAIRLDMDTIGNVLIGLVPLIVGAVLFARSARLPDDPGSETISMAGSGNQTEGEFQASMWRRFLPIGAAVTLFAILLARMAWHTNSLLDFILWIIVMGLAGYAIAVRENGSANRPIWGFNRKDVGIVLFLIGCGLLVASFRLGMHPNSLMGDEGNFFDTARGIAIGEYRPSFFDMGVYSFPIAASYWQGTILSLFGLSLWSWRFSSVLIGVLTVFPLYFLALDLFGRRTAILSAVCFLTSPFFLAFARLGYNNAHVFPLVTGSAWLLYRGMTRRSHLLTFLGGVVAGLGFLSYTAARVSLLFGLILLGGWTLIAVIRRPQHNLLRSRLIFTSIFLAGWVCAALPHLVFSATLDEQAFRYKTVESMFVNVDAAREFYKPDEIFSTAQGLNLDPYTLYFNPKIYAWLFQRGFLRTALSFFAPGLVGEHFVESPLPAAVPSFFLLLGFSALLARLRDRRSIFLVTWFLLVAVFLSALNTFPPRAAHMVPIVPVMALIIGLGIELFIQTAAGMVRFIATTRFVTRFSFVCAVAVAGAGLYQYFAVIPTHYYPDMDQVLNWAELQNRNSIPFVFITGRPNWTDWKPFVVGRVTPPNPFQVVPAEEFLQNKVVLLGQPDVVYAMEAADYPRVLAKLRKDYGIEDEPISIFNREGSRIGALLIHGNRFVWPPVDSFFREFGLLVISPAGPLALICLSLAAILVLLPVRWKAGTLVRPASTLPQADE